jgi:very-short-patch-repair endonuclease
VLLLLLFAAPKDGKFMDKLRHRARDLRNNTTDAERALWRVLRGRQLQGFRFRRQVPIGGFIADFVCPQAKLIIELDGGQHAERSEYDAARTSRLEAMGYRVLRYWTMMYYCDWSRLLMTSFVV